MKIHNLTPWELTAYKDNIDYRLNAVLYENQYETRKSAEETKKLIKAEYPKALVFIECVDIPTFRLREDSESD